MEVTDSGSNFVINCEDEELTPEAGLKDLQKFDETLRKLKRPTFAIRGSSSYVLDKWAVTHWDLLQFSGHFIEHVLRYTKKDNLVQQNHDVTKIVDLMLSRLLGRYIAQLIRFLVCTCDIDGLFSSAWRHFVASECTDKPRKAKVGGLEDALSEVG
ncbi:uncharacterized protein LOC133895924 [Phragmites australis]|uniref:uncharacterized protein LOC133895924 n=1 Tax=Phragmites australis TaxID=29695 RepID=UPI002D768431|nr:uncharacterized protein LOC133895924 [Phragmites australis]